MLWMAVVSQASENSSRQENRELPCREQHTLPSLDIVWSSSQIVYCDNIINPNVQLMNIRRTRLGNFTIFCIVLCCIDLFEFGISTVQCTTWEYPNDMDT